MKKMLLLAGAASVFAFNANAFEFSPYLAARFKYAITDNSVTIEHGKYNLDKDLIGGSGALGIRVPVSSGAFRIEAEYNRTDDAKKSFRGGEEKINAELRVQALMFNAYYNFNTNTPLSPYVTAGMGGARLKFSEKKAIHQTDFAWQLGFGVSYKFNEHFSADLGYRYIDYGNFSDYITERKPDGKRFTEESRKAKVESKANEIMLGIRYTF